MLKKISSLFIVSLLVGTYQVSLIENKLNSYEIENNISSYFPLIINFQNSIENTKLSFKEMFILNNPTIDNNFNNTQEKPIEQPLIKEEPVVEIVKEEPVVNEKKIIIESNELTSLKTQSTINTEVPIVEISSSTSNIESTLSANNDTNILINKKCIKNCIVLMIGDSVMGDVYYSLSRKIKKEHPDFTIIDGHKVSSGLSNSTYYDWPTIARQLTEKYHPNYTFILLGMNDAQGVYDNKKGFAFGSDSWVNIYKHRTQLFKEAIVKNSDNVFWIELPQVRENKFNGRLSIIRNIHKEENQINFIETSLLLGNNNDKNFSNFRQNDGIHLNAQGSDKITTKIIELFKI